MQKDGGYCGSEVLGFALAPCHSVHYGMQWDNEGGSEGDDETKWCQSAWSLREFQPQPKPHDQLAVDLLVGIPSVPGGALTNSMPMCQRVVSCLPGNCGKLWPREASKLSAI